MAELNCAWCNKPYISEASSDTVGTTDGICKKCKANMDAEARALGYRERDESSPPDWPGGSEAAFKAQQSRKLPELDIQRSSEPLLENYGFLGADTVAETVSGVSPKAYRELWSAINTVTHKADWERGRLDPPSLEEVWRYLSPQTKSHLKSLDFDA